MTDNVIPFPAKPPLDDEEAYFQCGRCHKAGEKLEGYMPLVRLDNQGALQLVALMCMSCGEYVEVSAGHLLTETVGG